MAKNFCIIILVLFFYDSAGEPVQNSCVKCVYDHELALKVREATGHNDGPRVEMYLRSVGLTKGEPWCAAFVKWVFDHAHIKTSINGAAKSTFNKDNLVWFNKKTIKTPESGDVFNLYGFVKKENTFRIYHCGFFDMDVNGTFYSTVEGNSLAKGSSEGDGVYSVKRSYRATYAMSRWTHPAN